MSKKESVPKIQVNEYTLFELLNTFKYLDIEFIHKYIYNSITYKSLCNKVQQLEYHGYLKSLSFFEDSRMIKVIMNDAKAKSILKFHGHKVIETRENISHYIKHQLALANSMVHYYGAVDQVNLIRTEALISENEISLSGFNISLRPDLGMVININGINTLYFIELERSYTSPYKLKRKMYNQYTQINKYINQLKFVQYFDVKAIRILFISTDKNKQKNVMKQLQKIGLKEIEILFSNQKKIEKHISEGKNIFDLEYQNLFNKKNKIYEKISK